MKLSGILRFAADRISLGRKKFLLTTIMLFVSFCMLIGVLLGFYQYYDYLMQVHHAIKCNKDQLYKIECKYFESLDEGNAENFFSFMEDLKEIKGIRPGKFQQTDMNYRVITTEQEEREIVSLIDFSKGISESETANSAADFFKGCETAEALFLDNQLGEICGLSDVADKPLDLNESEEWTDVAVGYEKQKDLPVGTRFYSLFTGRKYQVTRVLKKGSTFIPSNLFWSPRPAILLDDCIVTLPDDRYMTGGYSSLYQVYINNTYFLMEEGQNREEVIAQVQEAAKDNGRWVTAKSFHRLEAEYKDAKLSDRSLVLVLTVIFLLLSVMNIFLSVLLSLLSQKKELGIMLSCGFETRDLYRILFAENVMRFFIALVPTCAFALFYYGNFMESNFVYLVKILPVTAVILFSILALTAIMPIVFFHGKYPVEFK